MFHSSLYHDRKFPLRLNHEHHYCLMSDDLNSTRMFGAATSTSSQVIPILNKSLLTVLLQFVRGRPGPLELRNLPVQRLSRYALVIHSYHMSKTAESSFTEYVVHTVLSSSDSDLFVYCLLICNPRHQHYYEHLTL